MTTESMMLSNHLILYYLFFFCPQSFPASESFPMNQLFAYGGQTIGVSASTSVLPMNIQGWFPLELTGVISLQSNGLSESSIPQLKSINSSVFSLLYGPTLHIWTVMSIYLYMTTGKTIALNIQTFVSKVISLLFNMLSRFFIAFLSRSKHLLISWLQSLSTVILEPKKIKSVTISTFPPSIYHDMMGPDAMVFVFWILSFNPTFSLSPFTLNKRLFSCSSFSAITVVDISPRNLDSS